MKSVIALIFALVAVSAFATSVTYRFWEDSVNEFTPHTLTLELDGPFKRGAKVKRLVIREVLGARVTDLFELKGKELARALKFSWRGNTLVVKMGTNTSIPVVAKAPVSNGWGDTDIDPKDDYSVWIDGQIELSVEGTLNGVSFEISNNSAEESAMWGILKK